MIWRLLLFELVLLLVVTGVWLLGPLVGMTSVFWRVVVILLIVLPPIIYLIVKFIKQRRAANALESAMHKQGEEHKKAARPDRREDIQALNSQFSDAITSLKRSKLARGRGSPLYALPWYMIIGPPAAGKSTALLRSGLRFPFAPGGEAKAVKGVGGTRNCDWWFSDQAILLDTAGRYTSEDDDQEEWLAFLRMVRRYRRRRPLNGLMVAVSIADVIVAKPGQIEEMAAKIRGRIDQVINELHMALPIYVLFTKCDLISGFVESFSDVSRQVRSQVLGFTIPLTDANTDIEALFRSEFDMLQRRLSERALARMSRVKSAMRSPVYQFPLQLKAARDNLADLVVQLMAPNPYQEIPRLRGVYFCSGTQEGRPIDRVLSQMTKALGLSDAGEAVFQPQVKKKSYFLRDVFTKVIFPDQNLAGITERGRRRRRIIGISTLATAGVLTFIVSAWAITSFINNYALVKTTEELARNSRITTPDDPRKVADSIKAMDQLGARVDLLRSYLDGEAPWSHSFGLYQGDQLFGPAEGVYIKRMWRAFVDPAGTELEATLIDIASATDQVSGEAASDFDLLKTYLMVTEPKRLKREFAARILIGQWDKRLHPEVADQQELLKRNAMRYLALLKKGRAEWLDRSESMVQNVRQALKARDAEYRRMIGNAEELLRPLTLRDALRNRVQSAMLAKDAVPGIYTVAGWRREMRKRLAKKAVTGVSIEPWVLGEDEETDLTARLRNRYYEQYIDAWRRFIRGLSIKQALTAQESLRLLETLTDSPSLYEELFESIAYNTRLLMVELPKTGNSGLRYLGYRVLPRRLRRLVYGARRYGLTKLAKDQFAKNPLTPVCMTFWPLRELVIPPEGMDERPQESGVKQYVAQLQRVQEVLQQTLAGNNEDTRLEPTLEEALKVTKGVLATLPGDLRRLVEPLFYAPLQDITATAPGVHAKQLKESVDNELCTGFKERLQGRYPFAKSQRDALMQDVIEFFSPKGSLWTYYDRRLKTRLPRQGDTFVPASEASVPPAVVRFINQAWQITRGLFPFGSELPRLRFEVRPLPVILGSTAYQVSEVVLEVEGRSRSYRMGPPEQWELQWSGEGKRSRILLRGAAGLHEEISNKGDWSLLRLIDRGKIRQRGSWYRVEWSFKDGQIRVPMEFRPARTQNLLFGRTKLSCK